MSPSTTSLPEADKPDTSRGVTPSTDGADTEKKGMLAEDGGTATDGKSAVAASAPKDSEDYPTGLKLASIVAALVLSVFLMSLDQTIIATAIPKITDEFHSLDDVAWYGSAFFMTTGGFQPTWGKVYKYFPLKSSFLTAVFIFELGSLICGVAPNSTTLIVGRAIAGVGAAGIGSGSYTIIAFAAEPKNRATYTGIIGASYGVAAVAGPLIGGVLTDESTWRWCFYINLPIGALAGFIILILFKTPQAATPGKTAFKEKLLQVDPLGTVLMLGALISFSLALQYGGSSKPWSSSTVIGLFVGFGLMVIVFGILAVMQGERAMLSPRLMRDRNVWVNSVYGFFFGGSYFVPLYYLPIYFQSIDNVSATQSGVRNLGLIIAFTIGTVLSGGFISKTGIATPIMPFGAVLATIGAGLLYTLDIGTGSAKWIGYQVLIGFGYGVGFQVPIIVGQATADPGDVASVTATILLFQTVGGSFLLTAAQCGFTNQLLKTLPSTEPNVDAALVVATGATELRTVFTADELDGILIAYMAGIKIAFAVTIGAVGISAPLSLFSKWKKINMDKLSGSA